MSGNFISGAVAEIRNVRCGNCDEPIMRHEPHCCHCGAESYANVNGYARLCKNPDCNRTEQAGHVHGLCRFHHQQRKERRAATASHVRCRCGNIAGQGETMCSRCRNRDEGIRWDDAPDGKTHYRAPCDHWFMYLAGDWYVWVSGWVMNPDQDPDQLVPRHD